MLRKSIAAAPITYPRGCFTGQLPLRAWSNLESLRRSVVFTILTRVYSSNSQCDRQQGIFALSKTFFRRNTDVFQGKMAQCSVKRAAVRVRWELEEYTLSHRYAERLPFFEGQPFSTAPTEPDSLAEPRNH